MSDNLHALAGGIQVQEALDYFANIGWLQSEHPNAKLFVLRPSRNSLPPVDLILPRDGSSTDFVARLVEAAGIVARVQELDTRAILEQIRQVNADVLRARMTSVVVRDRSVPLDTAQLIVDGLKNLVIYGACGEATPLPFFTKPSKTGARHVHQCRFGHTFDGSFGFTVESPVIPAAQQPLTPDVAIPFERRVFERIFHGLELVRECSEQHSIDPLVQHYDIGLNANMCDALLSMREKARDLSVEYSVKWSPKMPSPVVASTVDLGPGSYEYLEQASRALRAAEPPERVVIEGRVVMLKSDSAPWEDEPSSPHTVVIAWIGREGKPLRTRVVLQPHDYLFACDAHKNAADVSVEGILERRGKFSRLRDPKNFRPGRQLHLLGQVEMPETES